MSLNSEINKIYQSNGLWKIEFIQNKKKKYITCNNVFLCCGSIDNIKILKNNNLLKKNNKISFHPMIKVVVKFPEKVNSKIWKF